MNLHVALSVLLIFSAACYTLLGLRLIVSRREVGSVPIGVLFIVIAFWVIGGAIELLSSTFTMFSIGRTGHFIGTALVPIVAYVCFREYTGTETTGSRLAVLMIIPLISIGLAATNHYHELMWYGPFVNEAGEFLTYPAKWGPWFLFAHLPYSYIIIGAAIFTLLAQSSAVAPAHRRGLFLLTAACIGPLATTAAYDVGVGPDTISYVPLAFTALLPVYAWLIIGERIIELSPLAYETVFQTMQDPVVVIDDQQRIIGLNHTAEKMLSVSEAEALRKQLSDLFGTGAHEVHEALESGEPRKMMTSTGRFLHVRVSAIDTSRPSVRGGQVLMFRDVSDVEKAHSEIRRNEKLLRTLINHSVNGVVRFSWAEEEGGEKRLRSVFANSAAARFLAAKTDDLVDCSATQVIRHAVTGMNDSDIDDIVRRFDRSMQEGERLEVEVRQKTAGATRWLRVICEPLGDDCAATFVDITDRKAKERQMDSIATSDPLTGVLNRRGFERDAARRLTESADDATGALLFIDLNDFKLINDQFGHEVGDQLLKIAAERLRKSLRSHDIIGRPGGDEFVALVADVDPDVADQLARRLTRTLEEPYNIGQQRLVCAASIGLALYPKNANTLTGLLREADQAMYRAKARCRGVTDIRGEDLLEKAI
ncbi:MAG: diguanylate cyclase [Gammaproteobacteria bacterium]|nr:diguanylate cyclase [Gammaproteobacteria bacterium]